MQHIFPIIDAERNVEAEREAKTAESTSYQHLKSTDAFLGGCKDFLFAVRTIRPDGIGSCHLSHLFSVYQTKFSEFLILNLKGDFDEIEPTTSNRNAK